MFEPGHFNILLLPQGVWKDSFKQKLTRELSNLFSIIITPKTREEAAKIDWNEYEIAPLAIPTPRETCTICKKITTLFLEIKGINDGLYLVSHSVPDIEGFKSFFAGLFQNNRIKKYYYLELLVWDEKDFLKNESLEHLKVKSYEIFDIVDKEEFRQGVVYEITKFEK